MRDTKELQLAIDEGRGIRLDDGTIITSMDDLDKIDAPVKIGEATGEPREGITVPLGETATLTTTGTKAAPAAKPRGK